MITARRPGSLWAAPRVAARVAAPLHAQRALRRPSRAVGAGEALSFVALSAERADRRPSGRTQGPYGPSFVVTPAQRASVTGVGPLSEGARAAEAAHG